MINFIKRSLIALAAMTLCFLTACEQETAPIPSITLEKEEIEVPAEGGLFSNNFHLENPTKDGTVVLTCTAEWVTDINVSNDNVITFNVTANESEEPRETYIEITYKGIESNPKFTISQKGKVIEEPVVPKDFTVTIKDIDYLSAYADVTPENQDMYYIIFCVDSEYASQYPTDDELFAADMEFFKLVSEMYQESLTETILYYALKGETIDYQLTSLYPSSDYMAYVYGIDPESTERLTDITRVNFSTLEVEMKDFGFEFETKINGPKADITITPEKDDEYYRIELFKEEYFKDVDIDEETFNSWMELISYYLMYGYSPEDLLNALCVKGIQTVSKELTAETEYITIAFAVNSDAMKCSEAEYEIFKTGSIEKSENKISVSMPSVGSRRATVSVETTNDDPYALVIMGTEFIEKFTTDEEIAQYCIEYSRINPRSGDISNEIISNLQPENEYSLIAFGYYGKVMTTEKITRLDFTTREARESNVSTIVEWDGHYDSQAVAELDERWEGYADDNQCLMPVYSKTVPEGQGTVYYKFYTAETLEDPTYTDDNITNELIRFGSKDSFSIIVAPYDTEMVVAAIAMDNDGDYGKLWKSEKFTLKKDEVSDPQEFLDNLPETGTENTKATKAKIQIKQQTYKDENILRNLPVFKDNGSRPGRMNKF